MAKTTGLFGYVSAKADPVILGLWQGLLSGEKSLDTGIIPFERQDGLPQLVSAGKVMGFSGFLVGAPFEEQILALSDEAADEHTKQIGSAGAARITGGARVSSQNFSWAAAMAAITANYPRIWRKRAAIFGYGMQAASAAYGLRTRGAEISYAEDLFVCRRFIVPSIPAPPAQADIVVCAPGRSGAVGAPPEGMLSKGALLVDFSIGKEAGSPAARAALEAGAVLVDGRRMLLARCAPEFEFLTGRMLGMDSISRVLKNL